MYFGLIAFGLFVFLFGVSSKADNTLSWLVMKMPLMLGGLYLLFVAFVGLGWLTI